MNNQEKTTERKTWESIFPKKTWQEEQKEEREKQLTRNRMLKVLESVKPIYRLRMAEQLVIAENEEERETIIEQFLYYDKIMDRFATYVHCKNYDVEVPKFLGDEQMVLFNILIMIVGKQGAYGEKYDWDEVRWMIMKISRTLADGLNDVAKEFHNSLKHRNKI